MYNKSFSILFALAFALPLTVNAHSLIIGVEGANGVTGQGFGVVDTTPRDGRDQVCSSSRGVLGRNSYLTLTL